jgi:hypothetical protein
MEWKDKRDGRETKSKGIGKGEINSRGGRRRSEKNHTHRQRQGPLILPGDHILRIEIICRVGKEID